jgi:hypothetical protein
MRRWNSSTAMRSGTVTITPAPMIVPWMLYLRILLVPSSAEVPEQAWRCLAEATAATRNVLVSIGLGAGESPVGIHEYRHVVVGVVTPPQLMPVVASCRRCSHDRHSTSSRTTVGPPTRGMSHQRAAHTRLRPLTGRWQTLRR